VLGTLEPHPFHGLTVVPVVAVSRDSTILDQLKPGEGEVDHIFSHPLQAILDPELAPGLSVSDPLVNHGSENWPHENRYHVGCPPFCDMSMLRR
jgi:coenzyme A diphosphatase NUDT7